MRDIFRCIGFVQDSRLKIHWREHVDELCEEARVISEARQQHKRALRVAAPIAWVALL